MSNSTALKQTKHLWLTVIVLSALIWTIPSQSRAETPEPSWKFNRTFDGWTRTLNQIEKSFSDQEQTLDNIGEIRDTLLALRREANAAREAATDFGFTSENLLTALGPRPEEGAPEETRDLATKRSTYETELADFRGRAAQTQLIIRRTDALLAQLTSIEQGALLKSLLTHTASPFALETLLATPGATYAYVSRLVSTPANWWAETQNDDGVKPGGLIIFSGILILSISAFASRRLLIAHFGRNKSIEQPSYTRRLMAASIEALANGLLPALIAICLWYGINWAFTLNDEAFLRLIAGTLTALLILIAAYVLPHAALSPDQPQWRVAPIKPKHARYIVRRIGALGLLFSIDVFVSYTSSDADASFLTIYSALIATCEAALILDLLRRALWHPDDTWEIDNKIGADAAAIDNARWASMPPPIPQKPGTPHRLHWLQLVRLLVALIAIAGALAAWSGYTALSVFLIGNLIGSALVIGALFLLHALLGEWVDIAMHRPQVANWLNLSENGTETVSFWLLGLLKVAIIVGGAAGVASIWGLPLSEARLILYNLLTAIQVGGATISITDIAAAIVTLIVALTFFRLGKRLLVDTVLPQTRLDAGMQYSIAAVFGYVGIVMSIVFAATVLGVNFQSLLIVAGALSVGIGFGLQNIANNFVSGLILLFERPIRVGDLIEINGTLGHVTHINVRRTEVETFQRSEVMIPNSELISNAVVNWTHSDRKARVEINIGVAYGSDTDLVRKTLLKACENVERIVAWPPADVLFLDFGDSSLNFQLRCFTSDVSARISVASNLRFEIDRLFRENNIEIPFPQHVLHLPHDKRITVKNDENNQETPEVS